MARSSAAKRAPPPNEPSAGGQRTSSIEIEAGLQGRHQDLSVLYFPGVPSSHDGLIRQAPIRNDGSNTFALTRPLCQGIREPLWPIAAPGKVALAVFFFFRFCFFFFFFFFLFF